MLLPLPRQQRPMLSSGLMQGERSARNYGLVSGRMKWMVGRLGYILHTYLKSETLKVRDREFF